MLRCSSEPQSAARINCIRPSKECLTGAHRRGPRRLRSSLFEHGLNEDDFGDCTEPDSTVNRCLSRRSEYWLRSVNEMDNHSFRVIFEIVFNQFVLKANVNPLTIIAIARLNIESQPARDDRRDGPIATKGR